MNINEMWSKANDCHRWAFSYSRCCFLYGFVDAGKFRYFKLEILYRLLSRHTLLSVNGVVELFRYLASHPGRLHTGLNPNFINIESNFASMNI